MAKQGWWPRLKARWKAVLEEYGTIAVVTWFSVFALTLTSFGFALESGLEPAELLAKVGMDPAKAATVGSAGKWGIAYGLTQLTKPARIGIVLVLTPIVSRVWHKVTGRPGPMDAPDEPEALTPQEPAAPTGE
jgi:hypothetical protein